jgi:hypothetical protein
MALSEVLVSSSAAAQSLIISPGEYCAFIRPVLLAGTGRGKPAVVSLGGFCRHPAAITRRMRKARIPAAEQTGRERDRVFMIDQ